MEQCPLESFNNFRKRKKEEIEREKVELEKAIDFFEWLDNIPDGGRVEYSAQNHGGMLAFKDDIKRAKVPEFVDTHWVNRREFAIKINWKLYFVFSVNYKPGEVEEWDYKIFELPEKFADWHSAGY